MNPTELRAGISLAGVFGLRMLGLFLILPVFAVHAPQLAGGDNLTLVGIALGAYGLSQAFLQIPFGAASDRWGRKPVIYVGLVVFAAGSFLAAAATDTREHHRTKVMAMIGATIGFSFALSLVAAPALYRWIGMGGLFALTGVLSLGAIAVVRSLVPEAPPYASAAPAAAATGVFLDPGLLRLNLGIFILHLVQMAMFVVVPPLLVRAGLALAEHWMLYLPVVLVSFALMVPPILYADRRNRPKPVMLGSVALLAAVQAAFALGTIGIAGLALLLVAFFAAFNVLEALLPSLVSRMAPARARGTAIGIYNTTQTLGLFFGGLLGGWVGKNYGTAEVFALCALLCILWLIAVAGMRPIASAVNELSSLTFTIASGVDLEGLREALARVQGVREAEVLSQERIARLKVVPGQWDEGRVRKLVTGEI
jgi:predicted MFS family arabinose efflux permease